MFSNKSLIGCIIVIILWIHILFVDTRVPILKEEYQPPRDYRPSKWISNSALDVWYGNKSVVEIISREFSQIVDRIANRPVRSNGKLKVKSSPYNNSIDEKMRRFAKK